MNIFDVVIVLLILLSGVNGLKRGILKEAVMFVGTLIIYFIAFHLKDGLGILLCKIFPFFKLNGLVILNILIYQMIAFVLIASILFGIFNIIMRFTKILQRLVDVSIILDIPSKILGFIFGLLEGYIVLFIILMVIAVPLRNSSVWNESNLSNKILYHSPILKNTIGNLGDAISDIIILSQKIESKETSDTNSINLSIMKLYLDYNIITKEDAIKIIETKKLDDIVGIRNFVTLY